MKEYKMVLDGRIDAKRSESLQQEIDTLLADGVTELIIDMKGVEFLASMGIRVLLGTYKKLTAIGGSLKVVEPSAFVLDTLSFVGLSEHIVDMSTVQKEDDNGSDCDYKEPYSAIHKGTNDGDVEKLYQFIGDFAQKIGLSQDILNGLNLMCAECEQVVELNQKLNYSREAELTVSYTPEPKRILCDCAIPNHQVSHFANNMRRMNEKSFDIDELDYDQAEELGKRAFINFFDSFDVKQDGSDFKLSLVKNLK